MPLGVVGRELEHAVDALSLEGRPYVAHEPLGLRRCAPRRSLRGPPRTTTAKSTTVASGRRRRRRSGRRPATERDRLDVDRGGEHLLRQPAAAGGGSSANVPRMRAAGSAPGGASTSGSSAPAGSSSRTSSSCAARSASAGTRSSSPSPSRGSTVGSDVGVEQVPAGAVRVAACRRRRPRRSRRGTRRRGPRAAALTARRRRAPRTGRRRSRRRPRRRGAVGLGGAAGDLLWRPRCGWPPAGAAPAARAPAPVPPCRAGRRPAAAARRAGRRACARAGWRRACGSSGGGTSALMRFGRDRRRPAARRRGAALADLARLRRAAEHDVEVARRARDVAVALELAAEADRDRAEREALELEDLLAALEPQHLPLEVAAGRGGERAGRLQVPLDAAGPLPVDAVARDARRTRSTCPCRRP